MLFSLDETKPVLTCSPDKTLTISESANEAKLEFNVSCSDNSGEDTNLVCSRNSGDTLTLEDNGEDINCTCTDSSGNQETCTFTVSVEGK